MPRQHFSPLIGIDFGMWIGWTLAPVIAARSSSPTPYGVAFLHQRHPGSFPRCADCCPTPGDASANDLDVGIDFVFFFIIHSVWPGWCSSLPLKEIVPVGHICSSITSSNEVRLLEVWFLVLHLCIHRNLRNSQDKQKSQKEGYTSNQKEHS